MFLWNSKPWTKAVIFLLGIFVGALLEYYFVGGWTSFWDRVHDWQTLIAGTIAFGAAILTFRAIQSQLKLQREKFEQEREQSEKRENRHTLSAKTALPVALSELAAYCNKCAVFVIDRPDTGDFPARPESAIHAVVSSIRHIDEKAGKWLAELVREYQVCVARLEKQRVGNDISYTRDTLHDLACLQFRINNAFPFSRDVSDSIPEPVETYRHVMYAFKNMIGIGDWRYRETEARDAADHIRRRFHNARGEEEIDYSLGPETLESDPRHWS